MVVRCEQGEFMSWMTKDDEIKILGMENHNLKKQIEQLKADLKREQVLANSILQIASDDHEKNHTVKFVKLAYLTQQQRREG